MKKFIKEDLDFYLPENFKGIDKLYMMKAIFDENIQKKWKPKVGDVIAGCTGNIFVISGEHNLIEELGGKLFFFGGGLCNRTGGNVMNETYCYSMNKSGIWYTYNENFIIVEKTNYYHSSFDNYRFIPYPHEYNKAI